MNWWIATDGAESAVSITFDLQLNGNPVSRTASPIVSGQVVGTALVGVTVVPSTLELINTASAAVFIPQTAAQGDITITRVSSLRCSIFKKMKVCGFP